MVDFCPDCSSLLRTKNVDGKASLACRCGYVKEENVEDALERKKDIEKKVQEKKKALEANTIVVSEEDKQISVHMEVNEVCPHCGFNKAESWQEQTRSADEPSTSFFRCKKCRKSWREY